MPWTKEERAKVAAEECRCVSCQESAPGDLSDAYGAAGEMLRSKRFKTVVILRDSQGYDHPENTGKWFLDRIIK